MGSTQTYKNSVPFLIGGLFSCWNQHLRDLEFTCGPWIVINEKLVKKWKYTHMWINLSTYLVLIYVIGHDLGQKVRVIQKINRWSDLKILSWKVSFCGFMKSQERILQLDHFCRHWSIKLPMKFFAPIMRYTNELQKHLVAIT